MEKKIFRILEPSVAMCFVVMLVFAAVSFLLNELVLAAAEGGVAVILFVYHILLTQKQKKELEKYILSTTTSRDSAMASGVPFPMAIIRFDNDEIMWANSAFQAATHLTKSVFNAKMADIIPAFSSLWILDGKTEYPGEILLGERRYRVYGNMFRPKGADAGHLMGVIYLLDQTNLLDVQDEYIRSRPVVANILIDNYDELTNNLTDGQVSILNAQIDAKITSWTGNMRSLNRKIERNRYLLVFESKFLPALEEAKFSLLESIRTILNPSGVAATVSIGIGKEGTDFEESYNFAALAVEMALSRGGDQAVIKDRYNFTFFGGRAREAQRHTKVKSRVVASTLAELVRQSEQIFVMGHKNADLDAVGAAAGIQCLCRTLGKQAKIVLDPRKNVAQELITLLRDVEGYEGAFITPDDALILADPKSLLIVVDTNRPDQVESQALLEAAPKVALIDHHRKTSNSIEQTVLSLHEPSASSASELVTELLQYAVEPQDVLPEEAKSLLAGIVLDTKNFAVRTGSGTFEAAAFLRRLGGDPTEVKKMFQSDLTATVARYRIVQCAKVYPHQVAIAALDYASNRATAAQAADELLSISGIESSFVLYPDGNKVIVSARSLGECNVQLILEPLGGGGNAATAGAQIPGKSVQLVLQELLASIEKYYEEA